MSNATRIASLTASLRAETAAVKERDPEREQLKSDFPAFAHAEKMLNGYYDKLSRYQRTLGRSKAPGIDKHKKALDKALGTYVTLMAQIKNAETALYA